MLADHPVAEGVEGRDDGVRVAVRDEPIDPGLHLLGGLVGEGEGQDLRGLGAPGGDQPGDPPGDDLGLAGAGAGDDEERTLAVGDRALLVGVEAGEQRVDAGRRRPPRRLPVDGDVVAPDGDLLELRGLAGAAGVPSPAASSRRPSAQRPWARAAARRIASASSSESAPSATPARTAFA